MRLLICALGGLLLTSCFPRKPAVATSPKPQIPAVPLSGRIAPAPAAPVPKPAAPPVSARITNRQISGIQFEGISFDSRTHRLVVVDQENGPGTRFTDAAAAARSRNGVAAFNAGFFTPEGAPLGLAISGGKSAGAWNSASSLGSGVWHESFSGTPTITRRETLGRSRAAQSRELLQAGPLVVENGRATSGLESTKSSARTLIAWDGGTRWWIGRSSPCTLAALGQAITHDSPAGWKVSTALNLDGGRSSDLWISGEFPGGPLIRRAPWNRPVRNFLVLLPK
jgi:hypothetical protein